MDNALFRAVDDYLFETLVPPDPVLEAVLRANHDAGLPPIDVSPLQGRFLNLMVRMCGARRVLEIGTLGGYSTIELARALPEGGRLVTLEFSPLHAEVAGRNIAAAGLADKVEIRVGRAVDTLPDLEHEGEGRFDFVFIDADKPSNLVYLEWAIRLGRPGAVIVLDNVVRDGRVTDPDDADANVRGTREALAFIGSHPRLKASALQIVGAKHHDGFAVMIVE